MVKTQASYFYGKLFGIFLLLINSLLLANDRRFPLPFSHKEIPVHILDSSHAPSTEKSDTIFVSENTLIYDSQLIYSSENKPVKIVHIQKERVKLKKTFRKKKINKKFRKKKPLKIPARKYKVFFRQTTSKTSISHTWNNILKTFITTSNTDKKAAALKSYNISLICKYLIYLIRFFIDYSFPFIVSIFFIAAYRLRPPPLKKILKWYFKFIENTFF